nr:NF-X1-type zinc finger protein NFXL2-like [Coffea arabica]
MKITDSELQLRKSVVTQKKEPDGEKPVAKRRRRRERVQEDKKASRLQVISGATRKVLLIVIILVTLIAVAYCGYNGLLWLSDWMNEAELQRQRRIYPRI